VSFAQISCVKKQFLLPLYAYTSCHQYDGISGIAKNIFSSYSNLMPSGRKKLVFWDFLDLFIFQVQLERSRSLQVPPSRQSCSPGGVTIFALPAVPGQVFKKTQPNWSFWADL